MVTVSSSEEVKADERMRKAFFIVKPDRSQLTRTASLLGERVIKTFVRSVITLLEAPREYVTPSRGTGYGKTVVENSKE